MAKTEMSYSSTSAAATSSCVDSGFEAQSTTSAPPAFSVRARFAVSVVTWRQAEIRYPASGCSRSRRSRIAASTGIWRSAHSMRRTPSGASAMALTSCLFVVAIRSFPLGGEQSLVLSLLPVEGGQPRPGDPRLDRCPQRRLAFEAGGEGDVRQLDAEATSQLAERPQLVELEQAVQAVARAAPGRYDQPRPPEIAQHARRPARLPCGLADRQSVHAANLNTVVSWFARALAPVAVFEPDDVVAVGGRDLEDRRVFERQHSMDGARGEVERSPGPHDLLLQHRIARGAQLDLRPPRLHQ